jgi:hypothetical protein
MDQRKRTNLIIRIVIACGVVVFLWILVRGTLKQKQFQYTVCMNFRGSSHCATAAGLTASEAIRSAQEIDCSQLANGRDANMVCLAQDPSSIQQVNGQ